MKHVNLEIKDSSIHYIYGFPTCGKTTAQRVLRFLPREFRSKIGVPATIDATDTDEWLATFKMSQNPDKKERIKEVIHLNFELIKELNSNHPRVLFTNMWNQLADADIDPTAIFIPEINRAREIVSERVKIRGDLNPSWIVDQVEAWMERIVTSDWFKRNESKVIQLTDEDFMLNHLKINDCAIPFTFNKERAMVLVDSLHKSIL